MRSVRATLVVGTVTAMAVVLAGAGVILHAILRHDLEQKLDSVLVESARLLASTMEQGAKKVDGEFHEFDMRELEQGERPGYLQLWLEDGSVFFRSRSLGEKDLAREAGTIDAPLLRSGILPDYRPGRFLGVTFTPRVDRRRDGTSKAEETPGWKARTVTMVLARGREPVDEPAARMAVFIASVSLMAIGVSTALLWWIIRGSLRPLERLAAQISLLDEHGLSSRIDEGGAPKELLSVAARLNDLLGRLDAAFRRERTLSADVAHELRTPIAGLRSTIEVTLARARDPGQYQEALSDCLGITLKLQHLVDRILSLARLDSGQIVSRPERVLPNEVLRSAWKPYEGRASSLRLKIEWELMADREVVTDPSLLGLVLRNAFENAVDHVGGGGWIRIETFEERELLKIRVSNSGSALTPEQAGHVFERFWRGDAARGSAAHHCGLGLALVKQCVSVLGGTVSASLNMEGVFALTISLPARAAGVSACGVAAAATTLYPGGRVLGDTAACG